MKTIRIYNLLVCLLLLCIYSVVHAQAGKEPASDFRSPLDIPLVLSGNFGELRSNHFHSGIDIKTQGVEGKKVYASERGYVGRIKISTKGYGKALYVIHPNGYTTVYAHLKKFNSRIEAYVKKAQYNKQSFAIELFPAASEPPLEKGDLIALSGNSGGSLAPHLHFEIRETKSEKPVNPLFFNFQIEDHIAPVIRSISIYPLSPLSQVDGSFQRKDYPVIKNGATYGLKGGQKPKVTGDIGIGIEAFDRLDGASNKCGIYQIVLNKNQEKIYQHAFDKFAFHETRYLNAHMDYGKYGIQKRKTQRSFLLPNNRLSIYNDVKDGGKIRIEEGMEYQMNYVLKDAYGNVAELDFSMLGGKNHTTKENAVLKSKSIRLFKWNEKNQFKNDDIILYMPPNILYEDLPFQYYVGDTLENGLTPTYHIHRETVPLQSYFMLSINVPGLNDWQRKHSLVVSYTEEDGIYPEGGTWKGNYIVVKSRSFGGYAVMLDTMAPIIKPINIRPQEDMSKKWSIMIKITDDLSGISSYTPKVDGKWILMEYDAKKNMLTHYFDEVIKPGMHQFELEVVDKVGNKSWYTAEFMR